MCRLSARHGTRPALSDSRSNTGPDPVSQLRRMSSHAPRSSVVRRTEPPSPASRWSFAWINSNDKAPPPYHDLTHAGMRAWAELAPDLDGDAWYRPSGHVELATAGTSELEARVKRLTEWGYPARLIS